MNRISGIYKIQSVKYPERIYIGSANNVYKRWNHHINDLRNGVHHSPKLQHHFNKYGEDDLQFSLIIGCDEDALLDTEQYFLDADKTYFNIYRTARYYSRAKQSEESNKKRSKSMTGKKWTLEQRQRFSKKLKGRRVITEEARKKISATLTGRKGIPCSEERRRKLSEDRKGENNPMFGKHSWNKGMKTPEETRLKLIQANLGRTPWNKGKKGVAEETRLKMSLAAKGKKRPRTPEHQRKLSESRKRNNRLRKMSAAA